MLEARAHKQLKDFLKRAELPWPHNLTLSRLVARSLRRCDHTLIQLDIDSQEFWWLGLLIPLCFESTGVVLILSERQRRRLLQVELSRLTASGLSLPIWEGISPPPGDQLWLLDHSQFFEAFQMGDLQVRQLIFLDAELLSKRLRDAMAISIWPEDWELLIRAHPVVDSPLIQLHERLSRRLFALAPCVDAQVKMDSSQIVALQDLVCDLGLSRLPVPWTDFLKVESIDWASWAVLDYKMLNWVWHLQPLEPFSILQKLLVGQPVLFLTRSGHSHNLLAELSALSCPIDVNVSIGSPNLLEPIPIFAPHHQPLPNTEIYADHLLDHCRRLILGCSGLTIILLDDQQLLFQLTSQLAAEFGRRVVYETTAPEANGVICCHWLWWLRFQEQLSPPSQLIIALLPLASLESPLTSARVDALKNQGQDWFRKLLLPEALTVLSKAVEPVRQHHGRIAILDGRLRSRKWGAQVFHTLHPWTPLYRLLPS